MITLFALLVLVGRPELWLIAGLVLLGTLALRWQAAVAVLSLGDLIAVPGLAWRAGESLAVQYPYRELAAALPAGLMLMAALRRAWVPKRGLLPLSGTWARRALAALAICVALLPGAGGALLFGTIGTKPAPGWGLLCLFWLPLYYAPLWLILSRSPDAPTP